MRLLSWLRAARSALVPAPERKRPAPCRLMLEVLEARDCPSAGGLLDPTFGSGGIVHLPNATDNGARAVAVQPDGKTVVAGAINLKSGNEAITVQRLNTDGSLDTTFNRTGSLTIMSGKSDYPTSVALQPDGKILIGGSATSSTGANEFLIARVNANGTLDSTFANKGIWVYASPLGVVEDLAVRTDPANPNSVTGIVAAARGSANGTQCFEAIELSPAGKLDSSFGSGGLAVFANLSGGPAQAVAVSPSGEIYLAGYAQFGSMTAPDGCVAAVTPAGALDTTFGGAGYVLAIPAGNQESEFYDLAVQTLIVNGQSVSRLVAAGDVANPNDSGLVAAYTLGGALDTTFGDNGWFTYTNPPGAYSSSVFRSLALEADGSIVLGAQQNALRSDGAYHEAMLVGHLTANGVVDTSFGPDGTGFTLVQDGQSSEVLGVALDPRNGDILASGWTYSGAANLTPRQASILRLTAP